MGKTNIKVISFYEGQKDVRDILIDLITEKVMANEDMTNMETSFPKVEKFERRDYNQAIALYMAYESGLATVG
ncbi:hypothetical protein [Ruminococcus sp.]|uniref:hypothetical protein n=1 Tax=Ruminococcus sp. TaxID=41978 RepID=UPI0025DA0268|nr:hypothetical protein [Ruminococcus sp.]